MGYRDRRNQCYCKSITRQTDRLGEYCVIKYTSKSNALKSVKVVLCSSIELFQEVLDTLGAGRCSFVTVLKPQEYNQNGTHVSIQGQSTLYLVDFHSAEVYGGFFYLLFRTTDCVFRKNWFSNVLSTTDVGWSCFKGF